MSKFSRCFHVALSFSLFYHYKIYNCFTFGSCISQGLIDANGIHSSEFNREGIYYRTLNDIHNQHELKSGGRVMLKKTTLGRFFKNDSLSTPQSEPPKELLSCPLSNIP